MTLPADTPFATDVGIWRQPRAPLETPEASYYATQDFCSYRPVVGIKKSGSLLKTNDFNKLTLMSLLLYCYAMTR